MGYVSQFLSTNGLVKQGFVFLEAVNQNLALELLVFAHELRPVLKSNTESIDFIERSHQQQTSVSQDHINCTNNAVATKSDKGAWTPVDCVADIDAASVDEVKLLHLVDFFINVFTMNEVPWLENLDQTGDEALVVGIQVGIEWIHTIFNSSFAAIMFQELHEHVHAFVTGLDSSEVKVTAEIVEEIAIQKLCHDSGLDFKGKLLEKENVRLFIHTVIPALTPDVLHV